MSEIRDTTNKTNSSRRNKIIIIIFLFLLVSGYIAAYAFLPGMIRSAYQTGNCHAVLSRDGIYATIYPFGQLGESTSTLVRACAVYTLGVTYKDDSEWRTAYDAFRVYLESYPEGVSADTAYEHSATVLMGAVMDDIRQGNYTQADAGLDFILENYPDASQVDDALELKSDIRMELGMELREVGDFISAEKLLKEVNSQAQEDNETDEVWASRLELAKTYLAWGMELQSQKKFADAQAKFDLVEATDPAPSSESGPAAQLPAKKVLLYTQWGDYLVEEKNFANAIEFYEMAASMVEDDSQADEIVAKGYVQWAAALDPEDELLGSLVLLDFAQERSAANSIEVLADQTRSDLYLSFSESDGEKALQAMADAAQVICKHQAQPRLPIFGLNDKNSQIVISGNDDVELPETMAATEPASLHYVVCVEEETVLVDTMNSRVRFTLFGPYGYWDDVMYQSFQYVWNVALREIDTGEEVASVSFTGKEPEKLSKETVARYVFVYYGAKPDTQELVDWLVAVLN